MTDDAKNDLEDHIELLKELDKRRIESGKLRDEGIGDLQKIFKKKPEIVSNASNPELLKALYRKPELLSDDYPEQFRKTFIQDCKQLKLEKITNDPIYITNHISIWYAANLLHTLVSIPGGAHLKATFYCYYWIIRELYTADSAEWSIGGARASPGGQVSAYMTSECVNALLALADAHRDTSVYIATISAFLERDRQLSELENLEDFKAPLFKKWIETERDRSERSCYMSLQRYSKHFTLPLDDLPQDFGPQKIKDYCINFEVPLKKAIEDCRDNIVQVLKEINTYRVSTDHEDTVTEQLEKRNTVLNNGKYDQKLDQKLFNRVIRSHQGHHIARNAIMDALEKSLRALDSFNKKSDIKAICKEISNTLDGIGDAIHNAMIPTKNYLSTVLDHELATDTELHYGQPEELTWAAFSYGKLTRNWDKDDRLAIATRRLINTISEQGFFPNRRHFHFGPDKRTEQAEASCVIIAFAQLLKHVGSVDIDSDITKKILRLLEETRVIDRSSEQLNGWRNYASPVHQKYDPHATAQAVLALYEINSMLDERINHLILNHFSVKWPERELKDTPILDDLFYPDYGMSFIKDDDLHVNGLAKDEKKPKIKRDKSIAVTLQRMQSHVKKIPLKNEETCNSIILYGPAGTGKTFLVESLAKTCDVPMIEVTPSDIVKQGVDNVERRARTVFEALSLLTRVVILFDEFDPVLKRRDPDNQNPSVFSFLTPGMLPKLKTLHDNAEKRSVAYVLITNLIGSLDEAAIRKGRFDERIGIYPPDLLSRVGRFLDQINKMRFKLKDDQNHKGKFELNDVLWSYIVKIIRESAGKGMTALGKPGWFTCPKSFDKIKQNTPFEYFKYAKKDKLDWWPDPEEELTSSIKGKRNSASLKEYCEWDWINEWDKILKKNKSDQRSAIINCLVATPQEIQVPPIQQKKTMKVMDRIRFLASFKDAANRV